jgi:hypothetical protein
MILDFYKKNIFPTNIFFKKMENVEKINTKLIKNINQWSKKEKGIKLSNENGWHSPTNMHLLEEYKDITNEICRFALGVYTTLSINEDVKLGAMWANINYPGSYNNTHTHYNSKFSGVYYVKVPKNSGNIFFQDPRPACEMIRPNYTVESSDETFKEHIFLAEESMLYFFPAWLRHGVERNKSKLTGDESNRISISFNFI